MTDATGYITSLELIQRVAALEERLNSLEESVHLGHCNRALSATPSVGWHYPCLPGPHYHHPEPVHDDIVR